MFAAPLRGAVPMWGFYDHFKQRSSVLAVAMDNGSVIGTASLKFLSQASSRALVRRTNLFPTWLLEGCPNLVELGYVAVDPAYRGHGVANKLCASLIEETRASTLFATVHITNIESIKLVRRLGLIPVGAPYVSRISGATVAAYRLPLDICT